MADYEALTDDELEQENYRLQREKDTIREQQLAVKAVANRRASEAKAAAILAGLNDAEVAVLAAAATGHVEGRGTT